MINLGKYHIKNGVGIDPSLIKKNSFGNYEYLGKLNLNGLIENSLEELPIYFTTVNGGFLCKDTGIENLKGAPKNITGLGYFNVSRNKKLISLEGCPEQVNGYFSAQDCKITTLEHSPISINGSFNVLDNPLLSLKHDVKHCWSIRARIDISLFYKLPKELWHQALERLSIWDADSFNEIVKIIKEENPEFIDSLDILDPEDDYSELF